MKAYPSRDGVPVPTAEVGLALSRLNPRKDSNWNNHHKYWERGLYQQDPLLNGLRNLERSQEMMLKDQHNLGKTALHAIFGPPMLPTVDEAMEQFDQAFYNGEKLKVWSRDLGKYALYSISNKYFGEIKDHYEYIKGFEL